MDPQPPLSTPAKRGRFEIRAMILLAIAVLVGGGLWIALNGSPTRDRAAVDSSAYPASTLSRGPAAPPAHP